MFLLHDFRLGALGELWVGQPCFYLDEVSLDLLLLLLKARKLLIAVDEARDGEMEVLTPSAVADTNCPSVGRPCRSSCIHPCDAKTLSLPSRSPS